MCEQETSERKADERKYLVDLELAGIAPMNL